MRQTFNHFAEIAASKGFEFEREGKGYVLFSNELAPGIEAVYDTLDEAYPDIYALSQGRNPLSDHALVA